MGPRSERWSTGATLSGPEWLVRHRWISGLAVSQAAVLALLAGALGHGRLIASGVLLLTGVPAVLALPIAFPARVRTVLATASLALGAAALVQITGQGEAYSWLLLVLTLCALYQDWIIVPTVLAVAVGDFVLTVLEPGGWDPFDLVPLVATLLAAVVHHRAWQLAEDKARTDPLTGLANRWRLREATDRLLRRDARSASLLFLDLDGFKAVNDSRGHAFGDALLVEVAARLQACVRADDLVVRLGGDEFAVLVPGDPVHAKDVARRVQTAMRVPVQLTGRAVRVTASVGVATHAGVSRRRVEDLLREADVAMYQAKTRGRDQVVVYTEGMSEAVVDRASLAEDLTVALAAGDQLSVHYQPVVALPEGVVTGYEALLRWRHPTRGAVPPLAFIPIAEESGAIGPLGRWVLQQATREAMAGLGADPGPSKVAVNVSARQLADDAFVDTVRDALRASGLPAEQLVLEVTESLLAEDLPTVCERLQELRTLGVRIAIDDFGTGWSSLSYLRGLPADIVKIDRSFITDLGRNTAATALVATIVELARSLSLDVVAEGVETTEQRDELSRLGCGYAQGWLFGRPVPQDPARRRLRPASGGVTAV